MGTKSIIQGEMRLCMAVGLGTAIMWSMAFFCNLAAFSYPLLAFVQLFLVIASIIRPARILTHIARQMPEVSTRHFIFLSLLCYVFCAIATTFVQTIYFNFFDNGFFATQILAATESFNLKDMMGMPIEQLQQTLELFSNTSNAARTLFSSNTQFALMATIPCALLIALRRNRRPGNTHPQQ